MVIAIPQSITASKLRIILSGTLLLAIIAGGVIFYLGYTQLSKIAAETGERVATAKQSENTIQRLEALQAELESKSEAVHRATQVTADSEFYAYQDRLVNDLTTYASRANITITNISFATQANSTGAAGAPAPTPAPATDGAEAPAPAPEAGGTGLSKATVDITLQNPLNYRDLLNFLHYIEQNLTKLKVSKVVMTKAEGENVTIDALNLEVHLR